MSIVSSSILEQARDALRGSPLCSIRELQVEQHGDGLLISGKVDSFYKKQMAQEAVRAACRDVELQNAVDVL
jgi:hypothetical protein